MTRLEKVEELYPLLSNSSFYTDFVVISVDVFDKQEDCVDMFDIINTLSTLIKSTVYRKSPVDRPIKRTTKIIVIVDETTDPCLVREIMNTPDVASVGWIIKTQQDLPVSLAHTQQILSGNFAHDPRVIDLVTHKRKKCTNRSCIELTTRQSQILKIIQDRGCTNKHIAKILNISESTVKLHVGAILKKYGVKNRTQLAVFSKVS